MTSALVTPSLKHIASALAGLLLALSCFFAAVPAPAHAAGLTSSQVEAILNLLSSFNIDQSTYATVSNILRGGSDGVDTSNVDKGERGSVSFSSEPLSGTAPLRVDFKGSVPSAGAYTVEFGDGSSQSFSFAQGRCSDGTNFGICGLELDLLRHTYAQPGTYVAQLKEYSSGRVLAGRTITVSRSSKTATLSATPTSGAAPLVVTFYMANLNLNGGEHVLDFGDGSEEYYTSAVGKDGIEHTYAAAGTYRVELTPGQVCLYGSNCQRLLPVATKTITVSGNSQTATLSATPTSGAAPLAVEFRGSVSAEGSYALDFGDGSSQSLSFAQRRCSDGSNFGICDLSLDSLRHTYAQAGTYTARLKARLSDATLASRVITATAAPQASVSVSATPSSGTAPLSVVFSISGANAQNYYTIAFGDNSAGAFSVSGSSGSVSHTYYSAGTYTATVTERTQCSWWECTGPSRTVGTKTITVAAAVSPYGTKYDDKSVMGESSSLLAAAAAVPLTISADSLNLVAEQITEVNYAIAGVFSAYVGLFSLDLVAQSAAAAVAPMPAPVRPAAGESLAATLAYLPESLYETAGKTTDFLAAVEMAPVRVITDALTDALFKAGLY